MPVNHRTRSTVHLARAVYESAGPGGPSLWARLRAVPRMIRAVRSGQYTGLTSTRLVLLLAGVGYVVSPIDVVPEGLLLALGLVDDLLVIGWVATTLVRETEDFIAWEQGRVRQWSGQQGQTVPSHVVPD